MLDKFHFMNKLGVFFYKNNLICKRKPKAKQQCLYMFAFGSLFNIHLTCMSPGFYVWESHFNCEISNKLKLNPINRDCSRFRTFKVCIDAVIYCLALKTCINYICF